MPLVLVLILFVSAIFSDFLQKKNHLIRIYTLLLFTFMSYTTIKLSTQHKEPTAINKLSQYLINRNEPLVISVPLINYYLKSQNLSAEFMDIEYDAKEIDIDLDATACTYHVFDPNISAAIASKYLYMGAGSTCDTALVLGGNSIGNSSCV